MKKIDTERVVQLAKVEEVMVAVILDRIQQLSKEGKDDLAALVTLLSKSASKEEKVEILEAIKELIQPSLIGEVAVGGMQKSGNGDLDSRRNHLAQKLRELREAKGLTQQELATLSTLPQSHICRLEGGKHSPSHGTLEKLAKALGVDVHDIDYEEHT